ncbi:ASCH domain-containing protein [Nocardioides sp. SYSU D00038]|uniref:ASCH domain-containing protein n=1 Tax=Nocardioides sp. SYSU D00038 TaxID=2812554 RepID=UPI001967F90D|nr:ASCH domain-containing protein [Nocardioides sp. SYSU D00038]
MSSDAPLDGPSSTGGPDGPPPEVSGEVEAFWALASRSARLSNLPGYLGPTAIASVMPPAWSLGSTPEQADELATLVETGAKTATASAHDDYAAAGEPLPEPGTLGIVLDGRGSPRALVVTTEVEVLPFAEVSDDHAAAEGEGDGSLGDWRRRHEQFFAETATGGFREDMLVVLERFRVLHTRD